MVPFLAEIQKCKRRRLWLLYLCTFFLIAAWIFSNLIRYPMDDWESSMGYYSLMLNFVLMNTIFLPIVLAASASRICDLENKGDTYRLLFTMQSKKSLFHSKFLLNGLFILAFCLAETALLYGIANLFNVTQPLPGKLLLLFFGSTLLISLILALLQQILSLLMRNQLMPLFIGLMGTFIGIFCAFFPFASIRAFVPWGYYLMTFPVTMHMNSNDTVTYYATAIPWKSIIGFLLFGILLYVIGIRLYLKKEV